MPREVALTLTVAEIRDLMAFVTDAKFAADYKIAVGTCHPQGVKLDDGTVAFYARVAWEADSPQEGCYMLGEPVTQQEMLNRP